MFNLAEWLILDEIQREEAAQSLLSHLPDFEWEGMEYFPNPTKTGQQFPIAVYRQVSSGIVFHLIPGGSFTMGFSERDVTAMTVLAENPQLTQDELEMVTAYQKPSDDMGPVRSVSVQPFLIARFPVWAAEASRILEVDPESDEAPHIEDLEVAGFHEDAEVAAFLKAGGYRLPSEAEWEYACRSGGEEGLFWWGDTLPDGKEWVEEPDDREANLHASNGFGLVSMGAYPEYCADLWHESYIGAPLDAAPWLENPDQAELVVRGGAALEYPWQGIGGWLWMLTAIRFPSTVLMIGGAIRPVYSLTLFSS